MKKSNRRNFIKKTGIAVGTMVAAPTIIPASALGKNGFIAPSDRITMAVIGAGNQGGNDTRAFLQDERVQITAICDVNKKSEGYWNGKIAGREFIMEMVDKTYGEKYGKRYKGTVGYEDFRKVLQRKDIDTVEIATPDH